MEQLSYLSKFILIQSFIMHVNFLNNKDFDLTDDVFCMRNQFYNYYAIVMEPVVSNATYTLNKSENNNWLSNILLENKVNITHLIEFIIILE